MEYSMPSETRPVKYLASTLETIDTGMYEWVDNTLNLHTVTNKGIYKAPVLWLGTERVWQIKSDQRIRDKVGKLILPLITINRSSVTKDPSFKGIFQAHLYEQNDYKGGATPAARNINQDRTREFQNNRQNETTKGGQQTGPQDPNDEIVYDTLSSPIPVYVSITYSITLRTEYQQQMNDLMQPFITSTGQINSFFFKKDGHSYEAFIQQDMSMNNNTTNVGEDERMFETRIDIKVLGYLIGEGYTREKPTLARRQNRAKLVFTNERTMSGDKITRDGKVNDYKD
jgi:hypothetical protein